MTKTKIITGVAGVLWNDQGHLFISQRPAHKPMPLLWEFPGGKIEAGETPEQALCRELEEEIGITIDPSSLSPFTFISYPYPDFHVVMLFFHVYRWQGEMEAKEGQGGLEWVLPEALKHYPMPETNEILIELLTQEKKILSST